MDGNSGVYDVLVDEPSLGRCAAKEPVAEEADATGKASSAFEAVSVVAARVLGVVFAVVVLVGTLAVVAYAAWWVGLAVGTHLIWAEEWIVVTVIIIPVVVVAVCRIAVRIYSDSCRTA